MFVSHLRLALLAIVVVSFTSMQVHAEEGVPKGFKPLFNGKDLSGWHGMTTKNIRDIEALSEDEHAKWLEASIKNIAEHWTVEGEGPATAELVNDGHGDYLTTDKYYGDIELLIDYKTVPTADSGIYLRGTPQVQIWDINGDSQPNLRRDMGSGGLWNNHKHLKGKNPLVVADKPFGEWNSFRIKQIGARTWVWLNEKLVVDGVTMDNYFAKGEPLFAKGPVQLQTHGGEIRWRRLFVREITADEANETLAKLSGSGFTAVFNGSDLSGWKGPTENYEVVDGAVGCKAGKGGTIFTEAEYGDFAARLEFQLPPGGNNGLAIRYPGSGDTAYVGMCELQVLDNTAEKYAKLDPRQYHGSAYGKAPAHRGYLRPTGEWNYQEVTVVGSTIKVELNGYEILDADVSKVTDFMGGKKHEGTDRKSGHFGFAGHGDPVRFRNVAIKDLTKK